MTTTEFYLLVGNMRKAQAAYFQKRSQDNLKRSIELEREVDKALIDSHSFFVLDVDPSKNVWLIKRPHSPVIEIDLEETDALKAAFSEVVDIRRAGSSPETKG